MPPKPHPAITHEMETQERRLLIKAAKLEEVLPRQLERALGWAKAAEENRPTGYGHYPKRGPGTGPRAGAAKPKDKPKAKAARKAPVRRTMAGRRAGGR